MLLLDTNTNKSQQGFLGILITISSHRPNTNKMFQPIPDSMKLRNKFGSNAYKPRDLSKPSAITILKHTTKPRSSWVTT